MSGDWRVGRKVGRTIYGPHDNLIGIMDTAALATRVVEAVNGKEAAMERARVVAWLRQSAAAEEGDGGGASHAALELAATLIERGKHEVSR